MHVGEKCLELVGARRLAQLPQSLGFDHIRLPFPQSVNGNEEITAVRVILFTRSFTGSISEHDCRW
jgi:hypothetical protein